MNKVMCELNHKLSSGVKWKLIELRGAFTLESQINTDDVSKKVKNREYSREVSDVKRKSMFIEKLQLLPKK